jgi:hypothetical protein
MNLHAKSDLYYGRIRMGKVLIVKLVGNLFLLKRLKSLSNRGKTYLTGYLIIL